MKSYATISTIPTKMRRKPQMLKMQRRGPRKLPMTPRRLRCLV
jgi:hypothetical protein